jgi:hypothetical protein
MPGAAFAPWRAIERAAGRWRDALAMFALIRLTRNEDRT